MLKSSATVIYTLGTNRKILLRVAGEGTDVNGNPIQITATAASITLTNVATAQVVVNGANAPIDIPGPAALVGGFYWVNANTLGEGKFDILAYVTLSDGSIVDVRGVLEIVAPVYP